MKNFFDLKVVEFPANNFKNLFKRFNFDFKAADINADKFSVKVGMFIPKKNQNAATSIFERNSGISNFLNKTKNIR